MKRARVREKPAAYRSERRLLFDTNVIVAGLVERHPHHERAVLWLKRVLTGEITMVLAQHALAESFAVLTVLPLKPAVTPDQAVRLRSCHTHRQRIPRYARTL
jgi:predicted nucleic acid-binding protein